MSQGLAILKLSKRELELLILIVIYTENPGLMSLVSMGTDESYEEEGNKLSSKLAKAWGKLSLSNNEQKKFKALLERIETINLSDDEISI